MKKENQPMVVINTNVERTYKNAVISVIVEDGLIDGAKVLVDGELIGDMEISSKDNPDGIEYTRKNLEYIIGECKKVVDRNFSQMLATMGIEM